MVSQFVAQLDFSFGRVVGPNFDDVVGAAGDDVVHGGDFFLLAKEKFGEICM